MILVAPVNQTRPDRAFQYGSDQDTPHVSEVETKVHDVSSKESWVSQLKTTAVEAGPVQ
jgi:hypothetical protein